MADSKQPETSKAAEQQAPAELESGTYEVIKKRMLSHGKSLRTALDQLNEARKSVFGSIETTLQSTERITTTHNCIPRDMVPIGDSFVFGFNVHLGLKTTTHLEDVFEVYDREGEGFVESTKTFLDDQGFRRDFANLYQYYRETQFSKFAIRGPNLFMVFRTGKHIADIKTFKWAILEDGIQYLDNRSDHEYGYPPQHDYTWKRAVRDQQRAGLHPHVSIEDLVFVETVGGDLTIKVEDNTETGEGIYAEPVENPDQTLDDADIFYSIFNHLVLLKIRPYQEEHFRYLIFNSKIQSIDRVDSLEHACIQLPEGHGLIFANGYYLQSGDLKIYENAPGAMKFEQRIDAPNGEDFLYVFYSRATGMYVLLGYNLISQKADTPILCNGFCLFENGKLLLFKSEDEPQKHHGIQAWQTPYVGPNYVPEVQPDSYLYKLGNKTVVRCMSECHEVLNLMEKEETYANLYVEITKHSGDILDSYFWLDRKEVYELNKPLIEIRSAAASAIEEYEKVSRIKRNTRQEVNRVTTAAKDLFKDIEHSFAQDIMHFVKSLSRLRGIRGEAITLRSLRYVDLEHVEKLENTIVDHSERLSNQCVDFLMEEKSLDPYRDKVKEVHGLVEKVRTGSEGKKLEQEIVEMSGELEMLIEVVSNLKIDDPNKTTAIIDRISSIYSEINQTKAGLKNRLHDLMKSESIAEFNAQIKLLNQSVLNYLEISDTPEKCEEYANKIMVQVEELESRFSDFDEFILQLTEKREELYNAFENKKVQLVEAQSRRASTLQASSDRILKVVLNRADQLESVQEINGYFASDMMIEKIRDNVDQLMHLGETVKADEIQTRLKTIQEDATRQLKDRQDLYEDGDNIIAIGRHKFTVNRQALELSVVTRNHDLYFHLNGTGFFEKIPEAELEGTRSVWDQAVVSENDEVYRGEYLAFRLHQDLCMGNGDGVAEWLALDETEFLTRVRAFAAPRYAEAYTKGVHDEDGAKIFRALLELEQTLDLLKYSPQARALGLYFWFCGTDDSTQKSILAKVNSFTRLQKIYPAEQPHPDAVAELAEQVGAFAERLAEFDAPTVEDATTYLFYELGTPQRHALTQIGADLYRDFEDMLKRKRMTGSYEKILTDLEDDPNARYRVVKNWMHAFIEAQNKPEVMDVLDEAVCLYLTGDIADRHIVDVNPARTQPGMKGSHGVLEDSRYAFHYIRFNDKLKRYARETAPLFQRFIERKKKLTAEREQALRLEELKPHILTSFVRNKLINDVYLPLIGDNLAKQIGSAGENKRTDRMGLLLLISPPGYGKTTLMEYMANRLGLTFIKINGPAIGHQVTSIDPAEAGNAGARSELEKLNLALEMGDNVMLYLDDIQHTNPELLQKFISLCDAQRKIEGVFRGQPKTYDLRGKKVVVVMAGNPYTESGEKFQIPDMLSNRADTYNLGDIIGDSDDVFKLSYLENSLTSNPALLSLSRQGSDDIYAMIRSAERGTREGVDFEGNYSSDEIDEYIRVLKKLNQVRDIVLTVNLAYIESAGQEDAYRDEPPFLLQGSYRNMNRIAERVLPVMNDEELKTLVLSSYESDAQTLTSGAESNLLKFKELVGWLTAEEQERWEDIKKGFKRNQRFAGVGDQDKMGLLLRQMGAFADGLDEIHGVLETGVERMKKEAPKVEAKPEVPALNEKALKQIHEVLEKIIQERNEKHVRKEIANKVPDALASVFETQYDQMKHWLEPVLKTSQESSDQMHQLILYFNEMVDGYNSVLDKLKEVYFPNPDDLKTKINPPDKPKKGGKKK